MKTITYSNLTKKIAGIRGQATLSSADEGLARFFINARAKMGWEFFPFPDLCDVEERFKLPLYDLSLAYVAGDKRLFAYDGRCYVATTAIAAGLDPTNDTLWAPLRRTHAVDWFDSESVYSPGDIVRATTSPRRFYFCIQDTAVVIGQDPTTLPAYWYLLPEWTPEFSLDADTDFDLSEMGTVLDVFASDPRETSEDWSGYKYKFELNSNGVLLVGDGRDQGTGWFQYRRPVPDWSGATYATGTIAAEGDRYYYAAEGDFFKSLVDSNSALPTDTASWERIEFPAFLADYVAVSVQADMLAGPDGQMEKGTVEEAAGFIYLKREMDLVLRQQHQSRQLNVLTR